MRSLSSKNLTVRVQCQLFAVLLTVVWYCRFQLAGHSVDLYPIRCCRPVTSVIRDYSVVAQRWTVQRYLETWQCEHSEQSKIGFFARTNNRLCSKTCVTSVIQGGGYHHHHHHYWWTFSTAERLVGRWRRTPRKLQSHAEHRVIMGLYGGTDAVSSRPSLCSGVPHPAGRR